MKLSRKNIITSIFYFLAVTGLSLFSLTAKAQGEEDCLKVTFTKKDLSCFGAADGEIHLQIENNADPGECEKGNVTIPVSCNSCTRSISGGSTEIITDNVCVSANTIYSGSVTVKGGGTLIVCGQFDGVGLTIEAGGKVYILPSGKINKLNSISMSSNAILENYADLEISSPSINGGVLTNFSKLTTLGNLSVGAVAQLINKGTAEINGAFHLLGTFKNSNHFSVVSSDNSTISTGAVFENYCYFGMGGPVNIQTPNAINNGIMELPNAQFTLGAESSVLKMGSASRLIVFELTSYGVINGNGEQAGYIKATSSFNIITGPQVSVPLTGKLILDIPASSQLPSSIPSTVRRGTSPELVPCEVKWDHGATGKDLTNLAPGNYKYTITCGLNCGPKTGSITISQPAEFTAKVETIKPSSGPGICDGTLQVKTTNGVLPFTYQWSGHQGVNSDQLSSICAGDYPVSVTDAKGCKATAFGKLEMQACRFTINITAPDINNAAVCNGIASVTIGNKRTDAVYETIWSNGDYNSESTQNLCAGDHWVMVREILTNGDICEDKKNFKITATTDVKTICNTTATTIAVNPCGAKCDGEITLDIQGSNGPYSVIWSDGSTTPNLHNKCEGLYQVVVTGHTADGKKCVVENEVRLKAMNSDPEQCPPTDDKDVLGIPKPTCANTPSGGIDLTVYHVGAGGPYTFYWEQTGSKTEDIFDQLPGKYNVRIFDRVGNGHPYEFVIPVNTDASCLPNDCVPIEGYIMPKLPSCNRASDGALDFHVTKGKGDFTFQWYKASGEILANDTLQDLSQLKSGDGYKVKVTSISCGTTAEFSSIVPLNPDNCVKECVITDLTTQPDCGLVKTGSIKVWVENAVGDIKYSWSPVASTSSSISGLAPGRYTVSVEAGEMCKSKSKTIEILDPNCPDPSCDFTPTITVVSNGPCGAEGTILEASSGIGYQWSNQKSTRRITVTAPGKYTVKVTRTINGKTCVREASKDIAPYQPVEVKITASSDYICPGKTVTLTAPAGGTKYKWNTGATTQSLVVSKEGYYQVEVYKGTCPGISTPVYIKQAPASVKIMTTRHTLCPDKSRKALLTSSIMDGNTWYKGTLAIGTFSSIEVDEPGLYKLSVKVGNCVVISNQIEIKEECDPCCEGCKPTPVFKNPPVTVTCDDYYNNLATARALVKYEEYINKHKIDFRKEYINHVLNNTTETFTMTQENTDTYHYTLFYYDRAGNLVRSVPPKGVKFVSNTDLAKVKEDRYTGNRSVFTTHDYVTTYAYNSLDNATGQKIPDHSSINKIEFGNSFTQSGVSWNGVEIDENGKGIAFGNKSGSDGLYYLDDKYGIWKESEGIFNNYQLNDIQQVDANFLVAVGNSGIILMSHDGGQTRKVQSAPTASDLKQVYFENTMKGHIITSDYKIYSTLDGGVTWSSSKNPVVNTGTIKDVTFINFNTGYAVVENNGNGLIYNTENGGASWTLEPNIKTKRIFKDIAHTPAGITYLAGSDGLIIQHTGTSYKILKTGILDEFVQMEADGENLLLLTSTGKIVEYNTQTYMSRFPLSADVATYIGVTFQGHAFCILSGGKSYKYRENGTWSAAPITFTVNANPVTGADFYNRTNFIYWNNSGGLYYNTSARNAVPTAIAAVKFAHIYAASSSTISVALFTTDRKRIRGDIGLNGTDSYPVRTNIGDDVIDVYFQDLNYGAWITNSGTYYSNNGTRNAYYIGLSSGVKKVAYNGRLFKGIKPNDGVGEQDIYSNNMSAWTAENYKLNVLPLNTIASDGNNVYAAGMDGVIISKSISSSWDNWMDNDISVKKDWVSANASEGLKVMFITDADGNVAAGYSNIWYNFPALSLFNGTVRDIKSTYNETTYDIRMAVVSSGKIYTSPLTWEGLTWTPNASEGTVTVLSVNEAGRSMAVGTDGLMLHNSNLYVSNSWTKVDGLTAHKINDVSLYNSGLTGYAVGDRGLILKTVDGGKSWNVQASGISKNFKSVYFTNQSFGFAVGDGVVYYTTNGGNNWLYGGLNNYPELKLNAVTYVSTTPLVVGDNGVIGRIHFTLRELIPMPNPDPGKNKLNDIASLGSTVIAVGNNGVMLKLSSAGWMLLKKGNDTWSKALTGADRNILKIFFKDKVTGYATCDNGMILKTINSGETWTLLSPSANAPVLDIDFRSEDEGYIVTSSGIQFFDEKPARFSTLFYYDKLGRVVLSQNAKQFNQTPKAYSYIRYDPLGRVIEAGQIETDESLANVQQGFPFIPTDDKAFYWTWLANGVKKEVIQTYYDTPYLMSLSGFSQNTLTLRNRVSAVMYKEDYHSPYTSATYYDYDIHGNVKALVQEFPDLSVLNQQYKCINYDYDLISGKVNMVSYQKGHADQFFHRYQYDADNRVVAVETSKDGVIWEKDASYKYYLHGPVARIELGDVKVQGIDYAYTIHGFIKGVNSNTLQANRDIGKDGTGANILIPKDEFGYSVGYYKGDYISIGNHTTANKFEAVVNGTLADSSKDLYNGNITHKVTAIAELMRNGSSNIEKSPFAMVYKYDQLNRLTHAQHVSGTGVLTSNSWTTSSLSTDYSEKVAYDANGNITTLTRTAYGPNNSMDNFTYDYETTAKGYTENTNRLRYITDNGDNPSVTTFGDIKSGQDAVNDADGTNYNYDELGQLVQDKQEKIAKIEWTVDGKVKSITRQQVAGAGPDLEFIYNANRHRVAKVVKHRDGATGQLLPQDKWEIKYYSLDPSGKTMAVYDRKYSPTGVTNKYKDSLVLTERSLYGGSRVGIKNENLKIAHREFMATIDAGSKAFKETSAGVSYLTLLSANGHYSRSLGGKAYELNDYLSNVLATVSDKKTPIGTGGTWYNSYAAITLSASDYYPFGMAMPGRSVTSDLYRYGFNGMEKDKEVKGEGNSYTTEYRQYDSRVGRWLSIDPMFKKFPDNNPYNSFANNPIRFIDDTGLEPKISIFDRNSLSIDIKFAIKFGIGWKLGPIKYVAPEIERGVVYSFKPLNLFTDEDVWQKRHVFNLKIKAELKVPGPIIWGIPTEIKGEGGPMLQATSGTLSQDTKGTWVFPIKKKVNLELSETTRFTENPFSESDDNQLLKGSTVAITAEKSLKTGSISEAKIKGEFSVRPTLRINISEVVRRAFPLDDKNPIHAVENNESERREKELDNINNHHMTNHHTPNEQSHSFDELDKLGR